MDNLTKAFIKGCQDQDYRRGETMRESDAAVYCIEAALKLSGFAAYNDVGNPALDVVVLGRPYHTYRTTWAELASALAVLLDMGVTPL